MFNKRTIPAAIAALALAGSSCTSNQHLPHTTPGTLPTRNNKVVQAQNQFAFRLFKEVLQADQEPGNKMISPISLYMDLSMVYNGAAGQTRSAMQEALQLQPADTALLNTTNAALIAGLPKADSGVTLEMANAIWYRQDLEPLPAFLALNKAFYKATVEAADFSNPSTTTAINDWVKEKTQEKIPSIIEEIRPSDVMYLLNAVYFLGHWTTAFDPQRTNDRIFHPTATTAVPVPFMQREATFHYLQNDSLQMIELPYGQGAFSMYVLLPSTHSNPQTLVRWLSPERFAALTSAMDSTKVQLYLPKWESAYLLDDLIPELTKLGMGAAFGGGADFTAMYNSSQIQISQVIHKTYIKVDEQGTEAAAATSVGMRVTSARPITRPVMDVNRPFVYLITEKNTGSILFLGTVHQPES